MSHWLAERTQTDHEEVKNKIVSGLMFHVQGELREHPNARDRELLRNFFYKLIDEKLNPSFRSNFLN